MKPKRKQVKNEGMRRLDYCGNIGSKEMVYNSMNRKEGKKE